MTDKDTVPQAVVLADTLPLGLIVPDTEEHPELVTEVEDVNDTDGDSDGD